MNASCCLILLSILLVGGVLLDLAYYLNGGYILILGEKLKNGNRFSGKLVRS
jgi:hypothetical protein